MLALESGACRPLRDGASSAVWGAHPCSLRQPWPSLPGPRPCFADVGDELLRTQGLRPALHFPSLHNPQPPLCSRRNTLLNQRLECRLANLTSELLEVGCILELIGSELIDELQGFSVKLEVATLILFIHDGLRFRVERVHVRLIFFCLEGGIDEHLEILLEGNAEVVVLAVVGHRQSELKRGEAAVRPKS